MQIEANKIWQFQRYDLVYDYYHKSYLPRPINSIKYLIDIVMFQSKANKMTSKIQPGTGNKKPIVGFCKLFEIKGFFILIETMYLF